MARWRRALVQRFAARLAVALRRFAPRFWPTMTLRSLGQRRLASGDGLLQAESRMIGKPRIGSLRH